MKIWRRGHLKPDDEQFLKANNVKFEPVFSIKEPLRVRKLMFEVSEDNSAWPLIKDRLRGDYTYVGTEFTQEDIAQADWSIAWAAHSIGSFVPKEKSWCDLYYADRCRNCGVGWRQVAPFRLKREPKLGNNMFAGFGSAFELFCAPVVFETFMEHGFNGFETQPLILNKEDRPAESLKQLVVMDIARPAVAEEWVEHERYGQADCPVCGRTWHTHYTRGMLPLRAAALNQKVDFQLTNEWFGNGRTARREILFSHRAVNLVLENNWHGIQFTPVRVV